MTKMTDERLRTWLSFWKWLISAVVVTGGISIVSLMINAEHKATELEIRTIQMEKEYLTQFLQEAVSDNLERRRKFAEYLSILSTTERFRERWSQYLAKIEDEQNSVEKEISELISELKTQTGEERRNTRREIAQLARELAMSYSDAVSYLDITFPAKTVPLYAFEKVNDFNINCPAGSNAALWAERVSYIDLPEFPDPANYITFGCLDSESREVGSFISWYSHGRVVQKGVVEGKVELFYPNGARAFEGSVIDEWLVPHKLWNPDGTPFVKND